MLSFSDEEKNYLQEQFSTLLQNKNEDSSHREYYEEPAQGRSEWQRDYARVLYSSSYRRLQGKMQFLGLTQDAFYRNRLTHSHEVVQIAKTIAGSVRRALKNTADPTAGLDIYAADMYVIETAALAHDIGNPPFGHAGEHKLNSLMKCWGGYEGNAQTVRVLRHLERKSPLYSGLNLTRRSLLSVVKYNYSYIKNKDKFMYNDDYEFIQSIALNANVKLRTIDAQIMDLADEIAYAAHDLEDALSLKLFTIDELLHEFKMHDKYKCVHDELNVIVNTAKAQAQQGEGFSSEDYSLYFRKALTSSIVDTLVRDIALVEVEEEDKKKTGTTMDRELGYAKLGMLALGLKKLTFKSLKRMDSVIIYEARGKVIINSLFDFFMDKGKRGIDIIPQEFRIDEYDNSKEEVLSRKVCDYIAGMMDSYAFSVYSKFFGVNKFEDIKI